MKKKNQEKKKKTEIEREREWKKECKADNEVLIVHQCKGQHNPKLDKDTLYTDDFQLFIVRGELLVVSSC